MGATGSAELKCVDGSALEIRPVPARDTGGRPYEVRLELRRDGRPFGAVGPGCAYHLGRVAERLAAARAEEGWPDPDGRLPEGELFIFRRERRRGCGEGELSCVVRTSPEWVPEGDAFSRGGWRVVRRAVVEAWDDAGRGVRAVLTSPELGDFVATLLAGAGHEGPAGPMPDGARDDAGTQKWETSCNQRR